MNDRTPTIDGQLDAFGAGALTVGALEITAPWILGAAGKINKMLRKPIVEDAPPIKGGVCLQPKMPLNHRKQIYYTSMIQPNWHSSNNHRYRRILFFEGSVAPSTRVNRRPNG